MSKYIPPHFKTGSKITLTAEPCVLKTLKQFARDLTYYDIDLSHINAFKCIEPYVWVEGEHIADGNAGNVYQACCVDKKNPRKWKPTASLLLKSLNIDIEKDMNLLLKI